MNGFNKLECYITLSWKDLPEANTFAYWAHASIIKKMKCCKYKPWNHVYSTSFF